MKLEDIGFYTLSDFRAKQSGETSPMWRCEMILTERCNFNCLYCRGLRPDCLGDMPFIRASSVLEQWIGDGLKNVRFSGGEPVLYHHLSELVKIAKYGEVQRIAISTNGSAPLAIYEQLFRDGVNDFSISLDVCCSEDMDKMSGTSGFYERIVSNIMQLSKITYVTVGIVLTKENIGSLVNTIKMVSDLGVADIRIISAAQYNRLPNSFEVKTKHPILDYRIRNLTNGRGVRGLKPNDSRKCWLAYDDAVVAGDYHFPCVIYMREQGNPLGRIGPHMRKEKIAWLENHNTHSDPICKKNCLDVCIDYNNKVQLLADCRLNGSQ